MTPRADFGGVDGPAHDQRRRQELAHRAERHHAPVRAVAVVDRGVEVDRRLERQPEPLRDAAQGRGGGAGAGRARLLVRDGEEEHVALPLRLLRQRLDHGQACRQPGLHVEQPAPGQEGATPQVGERARAGRGVAAEPAGEGGRQLPRPRRQRGEVAVVVGADGVEVAGEDDRGRPPARQQGRHRRPPERVARDRDGPDAVRPSRERRQGGQPGAQPLRERGLVRRAVDARDGDELKRPVGGARGEGLRHASSGESGRSRGP